MTTKERRKKYRLRNVSTDRVDLVDKGANQHAFIEMFKTDTPVEKHGGPGPHPSGSQQSVHGGSGSRGIGAAGNFARGSRGKQKRNLAAEGFPVKDQYPGSRPDKKKDLTVREDPKAAAVQRATAARQSRVGLGTAGGPGSPVSSKRNLVAEGYGDKDMYPGSRATKPPLFGRSIADFPGTKEAKDAYMNAVVRYQQDKTDANKAKVFETFDELTGTPKRKLKKSTPGRRKALLALAAAKKRNKLRIADGKKPVVEGKKVSPSTLKKG